QTSGSGNTFLLVVAFFFRQWEEVIENGATLLKIQVVKGVTTVMPVKLVENKAYRRLEIKARSTLMMGIFNENQLKFNFIKDANQLLEAIEKKFDEFAVKPVVENKSSEEETKAVRPLIVEELVLDNDEQNVTQPKIVKKIVRPIIVKKELVNPRQQEKTARKIVKKVEHNRQNTHKHR
nr:hypothetical protein [Tanacetum cinerariifolium]